MKNARILVETLCQDYSKIAMEKKLPRLIASQLPENCQEIVETHYQAGTVYLKAQNPLAAIYGIGQIKEGALSGYLADYLGVLKPRFPLRPLWLPEGIAKEKENLPLICRRILEWGYNAIVLGKESLNDLKNLCVLFHDYGLKIILKVDSKQDLLKKQIDSIDYFFWEAQCFLETGSLYKESTDADLAIAEVEELESILQGKTSLIYFVPAKNLAEAQKQISWLPKLCDEMGKDTLLSFSSVVGAPDEDHQPLHPLWEELRASPDISATQLLPIINGGCLKQGEGLWPNLNVDLLERCFSRMYRHSFAGAMILTNAIPTKRGLLDCNLWIAARMQWKEFPPDLYAETWFKAYRPDMDYPRFSQKLKDIREIALEVSEFRVLAQEKSREDLNLEDYRLGAESLFIRLNRLQLAFGKEKTKAIEKSTFADYFRFFDQDMRRILMHALQSLSVPLPNVMMGIDAQETFWTSLLETSTSGMRMSGKVSLLTSPNANSNDPIFKLIYEENRM